MAQLETGFKHSSERWHVWRELCGLAGVLGPLLFTGVYTIDGFLLPSYSALLEPISNLGVEGPATWIQNTNFVLSGLLLVAFAVAFYQQLRPLINRGWLIACTFFLVLTGGALASAGFFHTDLPGYPPVTLHGLIHDIIFFVVFFSLLFAISITGLQLRKTPGWRAFGWYSILTALGMLALFVLLAAMTDTHLAGLFQRIFEDEAFAWYVVMGFRFFTLERTQKRASSLRN
jgi:hypothetical membrane protein